MSFRISTVIVAAVTAAYVVFLLLEFTGVVGRHPGTVSAPMLAMLVLLLALLVGDFWRNRGSAERPR